MPIMQNQTFDPLKQKKFTQLIITSAALSVDEKFYGTVSQGAMELGPDDYQTTLFFVQDDVEIQTLSGPYSYATDQKINTIVEEIPSIQKGFLMRISDVEINSTQQNIRPVLESNIIKLITEAIPRDMNYEIIKAMMDRYDDFAAQGSSKISNWSNVNATHIGEILEDMRNDIVNGTDYLPDFAPFIIYSDVDFMAKIKRTLDPSTVVNPAGLQVARQEVTSPSATLSQGESNMMTFRQKGMQMWSDGKAGLVEIGPVPKMEINDATGEITTKELIRIKNNSGSTAGGTLVITLNPKGVKGRYSLFCRQFDVRMEKKYEIKSNVIFNYVMNYGLKSYCSPVYTAFLNIKTLQQKVEGQPLTPPVKE